MGSLRRRWPQAFGRPSPRGAPAVRALTCFGITLGLLALPGASAGASAGATVDGVAPVRDHDSTHISLVRRFALSDVTDVVRGARGLYVLRGAPFPDDASGNGWEVDLLDPTTGRILETASGDAAPMSLILAFGAVWVSTGFGAMPGGSGSGVDRLDAMTLAHQARVNIHPQDVMAMAATSSALWLLAGGDTPQLEALDPETDAITRTKTLPGNDLLEGLTATADRIIVSYEPFGSPPRRTARTCVTWIDASSLKARSSAVVARAPAAAGAARGAYSLAATNDTTVYVGLESTLTGSSLVVLRGDNVVGPRQGAGDLVTASRSGEVWAAAIHKHKGTPDTSDLERIASNGTVSSRLSGLPVLVSLSGIGDDLYAGTATGVLVFKG